MKTKELTIIHGLLIAARETLASTEECVSSMEDAATTAIDSINRGLMMTSDAKRVELAVFWRSLVASGELAKELFDDADKAVKEFVRSSVQMEVLRRLKADTDNLYELALKDRERAEMRCEELMKIGELAKELQYRLQASLDSL